MRSDASERFGSAGCARAQKVRRQAKKHWALLAATATLVYGSSTPLASMTCVHGAWAAGPWCMEAGRVVRVGRGF